MTIMATRVHDTWPARSIGGARRFLNGQGVHIGSQPYSEAGFIAFPLQHSHDASLAYSGVNLIAVRTQVPLNQGSSAGFLEPELGMGVNVPTEFTELGMILGDSLQYMLIRHSCGNPAQSMDERTDGTLT